MYFCFVVCFALLGILRQVNSLECYVCDSQTDDTCDGNPMKGKKFVQDCANPDDVCGMSYTSNTDTLEKIGFNRSCITSEEQREIGKYGPDRSVRKKEKDSKTRYFQLVQVTYSTCNVSLCNSQYEPELDYLKCYICSSPNAPDCDYEGTMLPFLNNTFLSRCPSGSYQCALSYKMEPGGTVTDVEVSRGCISESDLYNKRRILGDKLVGAETNSTIFETHLFVCNSTGCNLAFPDEYLPISCIVCNDVNDPDCDLEGSRLSDDSKLLKPCPDTSPQYCTMWYKVDLRSTKTQSVVRSCVSKEEALRYKNTYGGKSVSGIYARMDYVGRASYHMTLCGSSGCNVKFPKYSAADPTCYFCSQDKNSDCTLEGQKLNKNDLKTCDKPDGICSMSYRIQVDAKLFGQPLSIVRNCISRKDATYFIERYGDEHDVAVFEEDTAPGVDIYTYYCYFPQCNRKFPAEHEKLLSVRPPLRCYNCQMSNDMQCTYEMTENLRNFIVVCPNTEDYRCFMSYQVKSTDDKQYNINRTCVPATEILALKERYGKSLIALEEVPGPDGGTVEHHMSHCHYPLCNLRFPDSNRSSISCYECTKENSGCDLDGDKLEESLQVRCPSHDPHVCVMVVRHNSEENDIKSIVRKCMPTVQADFYKATYGEPAEFLDNKDTNVSIYMAFCTDNMCNKGLADSFRKYLVKRIKSVDAGAAGGKLEFDTGAAGGKLEFEESNDQPAFALGEPLYQEPDSDSSEDKEDSGVSAIPSTSNLCSGRWIALVVSIVISTSIKDL